MIASHAIFIFASYLAFFLALVTGIYFLTQERKLKLKDPSILRAGVVSLETLDRVNWLAVVVGFSLFSFGMVQGHWLARSEWGRVWSGDPKEVFALVTWGAYAVVLVLRLRAGLRGRRVIFLSVMSFLLVLFTYAGVNHLLGTRHTFF